MIENLPASARSIVERVARRYGVEVADIFAPWPRKPEPEAARCAAMVALEAAELDGRRRFTVPDIAAWFGVSRNRVYVHVRKASGYKPRRALTA